MNTSVIDKKDEKSIGIAKFVEFLNRLKTNTATLISDTLIQSTDECIKAAEIIRGVSKEFSSFGILEELVIKPTLETTFPVLLNYDGKELRIVTSDGFIRVEGDGQTQQITSVNEGINFILGVFFEVVESEPGRLYDQKKLQESSLIRRRYRELSSDEEFVNTLLSDLSESIMTSEWQISWIQKVMRRLNKLQKCYFEMKEFSEIFVNEMQDINNKIVILYTILLTFCYSNKQTGIHVEFLSQPDFSGIISMFGNAVISDVKNSAKDPVNQKTPREVASIYLKTFTRTLPLLHSARQGANIGLTNRLNYIADHLNINDRSNLGQLGHFYSTALFRSLMQRFILEFIASQKLKPINKSALK